MDDKIKIASDIVTGLIGLRGLEPAEIMKGDAFKLPRLIPAGEAGSFQISQAIDDEITALAGVLRQSRPGLKKAVRDSEWRAWVRNEVGPAAAALDLNVPAEVRGAALVDAVERRLEQIIAGLKAREHAFGATLFSNPDIPRFTLGPVTIEPIDDWLTRKTSEGLVSVVTARRVRAAWAGKRRTKRKPDIEAFQEKDILNATRNCPYVVSVDLGGYGSTASLETAAEAARLALVTVSLAWARSADAMRGFRLNFDGPIYHREALTFVPGRTVLSGSSLQGHPSGPRIDPRDWAKTRSGFATIFDTAGAAIAHRISVDDASPRAGVLDALAQALFWFHAGCVQPADALAVVDFSACLDALSKGGKSRGILDLIEARLGAKRADPINAGGPSVQTVIERIYNDGRSRIVHGVNARHGHDWTETRGLAEQFARVTLIACLDKVGSDAAVTAADDLRKL